MISAPEYAGLIFLKSPGCTIVAVLTLALGVGATEPLVSVTILLGAVAFLACWWPARQCC